MKLVLSLSAFTLAGLLIDTGHASNPDTDITLHSEQHLRQQESEGPTNDPHLLSMDWDVKNVIPIVRKPVKVEPGQGTPTRMGGLHTLRAPRDFKKAEQLTEEVNGLKPSPLSSETSPRMPVSPLDTGKPPQGDLPFNPQTPIAASIRNRGDAFTPGPRGLSHSHKGRRTSFPPSNSPTIFAIRRLQPLPYSPQFKQHPLLGSCKLSDFSYDLEADLLDISPFSQVYRAQHRNRGLYVLKKIQGAYVIEHPDLVAGEEEALHSVSHPNVIEFYCTVQDPRTNDTFFVMEYVDGETLANLINEGLSQKQRSSIIAQLLQGLYAIHKAKIVHGDLKTENVMVRAIDGQVKLIDFGLSIFERTSSCCKGIAGTPGYIAPEVINSGSHKRTADLYGVGIILVEMYLPDLLPPQKKRESDENYSRRLVALQEDLPTTNDPWADHLVGLLCNWDPDQRWHDAHINFEQLKSHPFFHGYQWEEGTGPEELN